MPITWPLESSSGPPEFPGLIEASVWIALSMPKLVRPSTVRLVAEITPTESDCSSPKGLPIAATGSPTAKLERSESVTGSRSRPSGSTLISATSASASKPLISAGDPVAVAELDEDLLGLVRRAAAVQVAAAGHHVGVGDDVAVLVHDESGALAGGAAAAEDVADAAG